MARNTLTSRQRRKPPPAPQPAPSLPQRYVIPMLLFAVALTGVVATLRAPNEPERFVPAPAAVTVAKPVVRARPSSPDGPNERPFMDPSAKAAEAYEAGDYAAASTHFRDAIARNDDDAEAHSNLGQVLVRLKRPGEALPHFDQALALIPDRWAYHFNRARALALLERWDEAIEGYRRAQALFPNDYATAFNLARALERRGLAADAVAAYREYLRLAPDAQDADWVRTRITRLSAGGS